MADAIDTMGDDWLEGADPAPEVPEVEAVAAEPEVPSDPETPPAEQEPVSEPEPALVPSWRVREETERRQAAERKLAEYEANRPQTPQQQQAPVKAPDPYEDPVGYNDFVQQQVAQTEWRMRAEMSGRFAEQKYGKEKVDAAVAWAQEQGAKDPYLGQRVQSQASPVEFVVEEYERSRTLQTLSGKSLEDYAKEYAAQQGWIVSQPAGQPVIQKPSLPAPPRSLASAPAAGGNRAPSSAPWAEVKFALDT